MGDRNLDDLEPNFARKLKAWIVECKEAGYTVLVTDGERTPQEQADEYAKGRTQDVVDAALKPLGLSAVARPDLPKTTNAKPYDSFHNVKRGADYCIIINGHASYDNDSLRATAQLAKGYGMEWGGDWGGSLGDNDHLQYAFCDACNERHPAAHYFNDDGTCKQAAPAVS